MNVETVQQQWQEFLKACDPHNKFHDRQKREMRRGFLSGFYCALQTCRQISEIDCEDAGANVLQTFYVECENSIKEMIREDFKRIGQTN